jgi:hypothetical protein
MPWNDVATTGASACPSAYGTGLYSEPQGTLARSFPRFFGTSQTNEGLTGVLAMRQMILPVGMSFPAMSMVTGTTAVKSTASAAHGWYVVADVNFNVLAVTADQTDLATVWGVASTAYRLPFTSPLATAYTGIYYAGVMVAGTGGTGPYFIAGTAALAGAAGQPPILCGNSGSSGMTTPPALGQALTPIATFVAGANFYITLTT